MSGICSAHQGHEPTCPRCAVSSPEEAKRSQEWADAFRHGVERGAEAVAEWMEGAQWDDAGKPVPTDALKVATSPTLDALAKMVRERFAGGRQPFIKRPR